MQVSDIVAIQEHWLFPDSLGFLNSINSLFSGWGRCFAELNLDSVCAEAKVVLVLFGRKAFIPRLNAFRTTVMIEHWF